MSRMYTPPQTDQDRQVAGLLNEVLDKIDQRFTDLDERTQSQFRQQAGEISRMNTSLTDTRQTSIKRFHEIAQHYRQGGDYRGPFRDAEQARNFGRVVAAIAGRDHRAWEDLEKAGISPGKGSTGGFLLQEILLKELIRNVEESGIFERNCPAMPVNGLSGGTPKRTSGLTVYYPDFGVAATASTPTLGMSNFNLKRHVVALEVDNWMLGSELAIALGDYIAEEFAYALALAADTNWFMGDGTAGYCGYTGLFKRTDLPSVVGDSGDDTFSEMIAKSTYYLAQMLGKLPIWGHRSDPRWFMHLLTFFNYLGVRDSVGQPIANIIMQQGGVPFWLMGYPVEPLSIAPSTTAVSTTFALFGSLKRACRVYRHANASEFKSSDQLKILEGQTVFVADVPQDMTVRDVNGLVQLKTAAT
jgi:HK97 family phage major capsid protein